MNLYHLRYFVTLAHIEHYTRAAQILSITQPSLSHAISSLEKELGVKLFEKEGRNIVLTKCGKIFLTDVEHSLNILESSIDSLQKTGAGEGTIDIGLLRTLSSSLVPEYVRGFLDANLDKDIYFNFHNDTGMTKDILAGLKEKRYDVAFCSKIKSETSIEFTPIAEQELVVIAPTNHPLAAHDSINLAETLIYPHIRFSKRSGLRSIIDSVFEELGEFPEYVYEVDEDQSIAGLVSNNFGISILPRMNSLSLMNLKVIQINDFTKKRYFYMALLKDRYHAPVIESFVTYVKEHYEIK
ncbi:MAG: LysR family transcriptional regulator [Anaerostipes sp.]|nr:LysR family transcriptional regulator [Anaerostipes sp.]